MALQRLPGLKSSWCLPAKAVKEKTFSVLMWIREIEISSFSEYYSQTCMPFGKCSETTTHGWLHKDKVTVLSIECFDITAAYQLNIITIRSRARQHLNRLKDYLQPLVKVKPGQGQSIVQKIRNFRLLLMVLAEMELYSLQWSQAPQGTNTRPANRTVQASPSCP